MTPHSTELIVAKKVMPAKREFEKSYQKLSTNFSPRGKLSIVNVDNFLNSQENF